MDFIVHAYNNDTVNKTKLIISAALVTFLGANCGAFSFLHAEPKLFWKKKKPKAEQPVSDYKKLTGTDSVCVKRVMNVVTKDDAFYLEIPARLMNRAFLVSNKLQQVPKELNEAGVNRGINYENKCIRFEWTRPANSYLCANSASLLMWTAPTSWRGPLPTTTSTRSSPH